ncbi:putative transcriptional regulatory protein pdtaR [Streptomyces hundungensis]|uniref:Putative transcriptional regulatory protein pdtaR n=1 Tax=Streptomyces hundungensis TaxID=1077946 RepID=A0A387HMU9_9ACTN|nr:putative transcriptional regulatory protein pdtaR [Streptomyces hundungensis]
MRAVIAEDSVSLRVGLVKTLEMSGCQVAAEAGDTEGLLAAVEEHRPQLAFIDVRMPPGFADGGSGRQWRSVGAGRDAGGAAFAVRGGAVRS